MRSRLTYSVPGAPADVLSKVDDVLSAAGFDVVPSRPARGVPLSKTYRSKPFQFALLVRRPLSVSERMGQGWAAYQGDPTAFGKYKEEQRAAWADKRVTVSVRAIGQQTAEVSSILETYVDDKPYDEESDEEKLNQAIRDAVLSWFT